LATSREFVEFVLEQMSAGASARRMFGGVGIYRDGVMFALIADDVLYFKVTPSNNHDYDAEGLESFAYKTAGGRRTVMSYRRAPACCMDDRDSMAEWSQKAWAAACEKPKRRQPRKNV
jgi:DNA transformation protein and related proteins